MIMKKTTYTVKRFDMDGEYYVEVTPPVFVESEEATYELYLCSEIYGVKLFMFGIDEENPSDELLEEMINNNIDSYIQLYEQKVF